MVKGLSYSARGLIRTPARSLAALLTIALGIGGNASIDAFSRGLTTAYLPGHDLASITPDMADGLWRLSTLLRAAAGALFFIASASVASFVLSRSSARSRETAVRVALGARRGHLFTHVLCDSVLISMGGGILGVLLALWMKDLVPVLFFAEDAERLVFAPDVPRILMVSAGCIAVTVVCGLLAVFGLRHDNPSAVLQRETTGLSPAMRRLSDGLVSTQMATCVVLIVSTGLMRHGLQAALETPAGRQADQTLLLTAQAPVFDSRYQTIDDGLKYFDQVERAARASGDVIETGWAHGLPGARPAWTSVRIEPPRLPLRDVVLNVEPLTRESLAHLMTPPVAGRMFGSFETESCPSVVVDERAEAVLFGGEAVGRVIVEPSGQRAQIIGVVRRDPAAPVQDLPSVYYDRERDAAQHGPPGPAHLRVPVVPMSEASSLLDANVVSSGYFRVAGMPLVTGRIFSERSATAGCRTGVLNEEAAERYFSGDAVGGAVIDGSGRRTEIVGVVRTRRFRTAQRAIEPTMYLPMSQDGQPRMTLLLRTREATPSMLDSLRRRVNAVPGGKAAIAVTTLEAHLSATALAPERLATTLIGASAATALGLGILGLYGSMSDAVGRRSREFALRIAIGAQGWRITRQVMIEGARLVAAGTAAGLVLSLVVARSIGRIAPTDEGSPLWVWMVAPLILSCALALAAIVPAWRAKTADPLTLMRDE